MTAGAEEKLSDQEAVRKQYSTADRLSTRISIHSR